MMKLRSGKSAQPLISAS